VTVDCMLEFLVHLNHQHLSDLQFIEIYFSGSYGREIGFGRFVIS